jgi:ABC-type transport system involved in multi-copper enzyme maturation permease subunit
MSTAAPTRPAFAGIVRAEALKAARSRSLVLLAWFSLVLCALTAFGYAQLGADDAARTTDDVIRAWMMTTLFAALFGAILVGREFDSRVISRAVLLSGTRERLLTAKILVVVGSGIAFGLLAVVGAVVSAVLMPSWTGGETLWTAEATATTVGVFVSTVLAAAWGGAIALVVRHQLGAALIVVGFTLLIDPVVQRIWPEGANALFTISLSSLYRDPKPELLAAPWAALVAFAWIAVLFVAGRALYQRRDLP